MWGTETNNPGTATRGVLPKRPRPANGTEMIELMPPIPPPFSTSKDDEIIHNTWFPYVDFIYRPWNQYYKDATSHEIRAYV